MKIYESTTDREPTVHLFDDQNRLARTRALGIAQTARRAAVLRRPDELWTNVPQVGDYRPHHPVPPEHDGGLKVTSK